MPPGLFYKKSCFEKISKYSQENTCWKETPTQMFSCDNWEVSKNTYFVDHLNMAASEVTIETGC